MTNKDILNNLLEVIDISGGKYWLYNVDVCCGKALLISKIDFRFCVKPITDLRASSKDTF